MSATITELNLCRGIAVSARSTYKNTQGLWVEVSGSLLPYAGREASDRRVCIHPGVDGDFETRSKVRIAVVYSRVGPRLQWDQMAVLDHDYHHYKAVVDLLLEPYNGVGQVYIRFQELEHE